MSKIKDIVVLNTVTANGTDARVDSNGLFNVVGLDPIKASRITDMVITPYVAETQQVTVITPTAANNTLYTFMIQGINVSTRTTYSNSYSYTSSASATRLEIVNAFVSLVNSDPYVNVVATQTGSNPNETLTLTAKVGFPAFGVFENNVNITHSTTQNPVIGSGLGSTITAQYPAAQFPEISEIVAAGQYTTVRVTYEDIFAYGENNTLGNSYNDVVLFVREAVTNYNDLLGTYGTLTGLNAGYRVSFTAGTGNLTINTNVATSATAGQITTLGVESGDYLVHATDGAA